MMATGEAEFARHAVERLSLFSDAVAAIAITLLALDLPVPGGATVSALWSSVRHSGSSYIAFLISFAVIAVAWSHHHDLFRYAIDTDAGLRQLNMAWLLTIVLTPFATKLLINSGLETTSAHAVRFGFYALVQVGSSAFLLMLQRHLASRRQAPATPTASVANLTWQSYGQMLGFGVSIPLLFAWKLAWLLWIVVPLVVDQVGRRLRASSGQGDA
jgi:uncharacterized membrane protein